MIIGGAVGIQTTEVINTNGATCSAMPDYPGTDSYWPVGAFLKGKAIICDADGKGDCYSIGESYESFVRKRALVKYQSQSEVIKVML